MMTTPLADTDVEISNSACLVKEPVVSVLMLAYNHDAYLTQAIESVLAQKTGFPFELLVGEDRSTDATHEIALRYQRAYPHLIKVITSTKNVGMHRNHARLVRASRGEYVAYCEGDDYWLGRDKLQVQVNFLRQRPECGAVHSNYLNLIQIAGAWRTRIALRSRAQLQHRSGAIYAAMLQSNRMQTCTVMCRRSLVADYRRVGPEVDGYLVGDWPLFLYLAHESDIGFIEQPLAAYRRTPGSVTNAGHVASVQRCLDAIRMAGDFCDFFDDGDDVRLAAFAAQHRVLLWMASKAGDQRNFDLAWLWLEEHQPAALAPVRIRAMRTMVRRPVIRTAMLGLLAASETIKHCLEFREVGAGGDG